MNIDCKNKNNDNEILKESKIMRLLIVSQSTSEKTEIPFDEGIVVIKNDKTFEGYGNNDTYIYGKLLENDGISLVALNNVNKVSNYCVFYKNDYYNGIKKQYSSMYGMDGMDYDIQDVDIKLIPENFDFENKMSIEEKIYDTKRNLNIFVWSYSNYFQEYLDYETRETLEIMKIYKNKKVTNKKRRKRIRKQKKYLVYGCFFCSLFFSSSILWLVSISNSLYKFANSLCLSLI